MLSRGGWVCVTFVYCDTAIVPMECEYQTIPKLSNGAVYNDIE